VVVLNVINLSSLGLCLLLTFAVRQTDFILLKFHCAFSYYYRRQLCSMVAETVISFIMIYLCMWVCGYVGVWVCGYVAIIRMT